MKLFAGCRAHIQAVSFFYLIVFNILLSTEIYFDMLAKNGSGVSVVFHKFIHFIAEC